MNLLFVDDDLPVLLDLQKKLDWSELGFQRLFTAQSAEEAWKMLHLIPIDVMVCDIEMPGGSGLELLTEVRKESPDLPCIVLTSYARFEYAQKAIQLNIVGYLLKPVDGRELEQAIRNAITIHSQNSQRQYGKYWLDEKRNIAEYFWLKTALGDQSGLQKAMKKLEYEDGDVFFPVVVETMEALNEFSGEALSSWEAPMLDYAIKNICYEFFENDFLHPHCVVQLSIHRWLVVVSVIRGPATDGAPLEECLSELCATAKKVLRLNICCCIGRAVPISQLNRETRAIISLCDNRPDRSGCVLHAGSEMPSGPYQTPEITLWEMLLRNGSPGSLLEQIEMYFSRHGAEMTKPGMLAFRQDIVQMVYTFLSQKNIQPHRLFRSEQSNRLYLSACDSIENMLAYCRYLINSAMEYARFTEHTDSVVDKIRAYLDAHFSEDIQRADLAGIVYVSPDYLSRLFKKETGRSLTQYITDKRIEAACHLLLESNLPINAVALQVGFQSLAYFSKVFHDEKGIAPMTYRRQMRAVQPDPGN